MIIRCDSAAIVPNTSELLPEPETPVNTRQPALRDLDADVLEVVHPRALDADEVVAVGCVCVRCGRLRLGASLVLDEPEHVAVGVGEGGHEPAAADVARLFLDAWRPRR